MRLSKLFEDISASRLNHYYRSDGSYEEGIAKKILEAIRQGSYKGRYFTNDFRDAATYYAKDAIVVEAAIDDESLMFDSMDVPFVTNTDPALLNKYFSGVPDMLVKEYIKLANDKSQSATWTHRTLHGKMPIDAINIAIKMFKYNKAQNWGEQVTMPLRNLAFNELKGIHRAINGKLVEILYNNGSELK